MGGWASEQSETEAICKGGIGMERRMCGTASERHDTIRIGTYVMIQSYLTTRHHHTNPPQTKTHHRRPSSSPPPSPARKGPSSRPGARAGPSPPRASAAAWVTWVVSKVNLMCVMSCHDVDVDPSIRPSCPQYKKVLYDIQNLPPTTPHTPTPTQGIDEKYDVAVSTASGALDFIVVETAKGGGACVEYLRKHNLGRCVCVCVCVG